MICRRRKSFEVIRVFGQGLWGSFLDRDFKFFVGVWEGKILGVMGEFRQFVFWLVLETYF